MKRAAIIMVFIISVLSVGLAMKTVSTTALAGYSPSPSASPSVDPTPTPPPPASSATVAATRKARHQSLAAWERNRLARRCFRVKAMKLPPRLPPHAASEETWKRARSRIVGRTADYRGDTADRRLLMKHPGGSSNGVRWKPLARWVGWPESSLGMLAYVIMRESSGRPNALNASSLCAGLLQMHPGWYRGQWGYPAFDPFDPQENLQAGLWVWKRQGWRPWAL